MAPELPDTAGLNIHSRAEGKHGSQTDRYRRTNHT
jgi:hypothetical protein